MTNMPQSVKNIPTIFVLLGGTGDLVEQKIAPALYFLFLQNRLPNMCQIVGFSRRNWQDIQYQNFIADAIRAKIKKIDEKKLTEFTKTISFHRGDFNNFEDYKRLGGKLGIIDNQWQVCANKLFYLAVPPEHYETILRSLHKSKLTELCSDETGWTRVLIEKPFGNNADSARELDELLARLFKEEQIYRIDHYLAKEMIQGILNFRFSNQLLEPAWNNQNIAKIEIYLNETIGVEKRGAFYDQVGALKDVGQNHLLQMLSLITMDHPVSNQPEAIRQKRYEGLLALPVLTENEIIKNTRRGQYIGYQKIENVAKNSTTETFFQIKTVLNSPRFNGIPVHFEGGKRLGKVKKQIVVNFKHPSYCLFCPPNEKFHNKVIFNLEPKEEIIIEFWTKQPGLEDKLEIRDFSFMLYEKHIKTQYVEEYAKLLVDAIEGDQTLFVSTQEIQAMWRFIDPIAKAWNGGKVKLENYQPNTDEILRWDKQLEKIGIDSPKEIAIVGLGKMGGNIALHLLEQGYKIIGYDKAQGDYGKFKNSNFVGCNDLKELVSQLKIKQKIVWLMTPSGVVDEVIFGKDGLVNYLKHEDIIIDGGNSNYKNSILISEKLKRKGINFVDVGVSGGPASARYGACLMVGGDRKIYSFLEPIFQALAIPEGYQHFEGAGAGHFVKMVHNGIEYGMMQALAEGFNLLKKSTYNLKLEQVADIYSHGSVIEGKLVTLLKNGFKKHGQEFSNVSGSVAHTGEGKWTVETAKELGLAVKIIEESLKFRVNSKMNPSYTGKILSALREQFGGHSINNQ